MIIPNTIIASDRRTVLAIRRISGQNSNVVRRQVGDIIIGIYRPTVRRI